MQETSHYDKEKADQAVNFIEALCHTKGKWAGQKFKLLEWQEQIIRDIFGIVKNENGYRQFNTVYIEIPKKNGKSELAAAVALKLLCADKEKGAEIYGCASDRQQAAIVFDVAKQMVEYNKVLSDNVRILDASKRLVFDKTHSFYQVLSAEAYSKHGFNVHGVVFDELHSQPDRRLFDVMTKGSGDARTQPLYFLITTAGNNINSVCYEQHKKAKDIIDGKKIDRTFYPVIYGAEMDEDWTDPNVWTKANPSLNKTIDIEKVIDACNAAKQNPADENSFRQLRLNQWVKQVKRWMPMDSWDACKSDFNESDLVGRECYGGLDLSTTTDVTAFVLVFPPVNENDKYLILPYFWLPEDTLDLRVRRDHVPYDVWYKQGLFNITKGNVVDYDFIEHFIINLRDRFKIKMIAYDNWNSSQIAIHLQEAGFDMIPFGQGYKSMSPACKEIMRLTLGKKLAHDGNPVLRWMMDNIAHKEDPAGNIKFDKEKSTEKIDGAVALAMALGIAIDHKEEENIYKEGDGGLIII